MSFDEIPEDREPCYACKCGGSIEANPETGVWECGTCGWTAPTNETGNARPGGE